MIRSIILIGAALVTLCAAAPTSAQPATAMPTGREKLAAHSGEFEPEIVELAEKIRVAVGYGLANSIMIEGDDGIIIVDTMESAEAARPVQLKFEMYTDKPVKAIIYTHNHSDHIFGAAVFAKDYEPQVWSHATTPHYINRIINIIRPAIFRRSMRQFGVFLPPEMVLNDGIGPHLMINDQTTPALLMPTHTFDTPRHKMTIAGVEIELVFAPGETPDQIYVWLPQFKALLCGDNYYKSFPNLYAIRGTAYRDVNEWVNSIDKMLAEEAEILIPSHTRPVVGAENVRETLTNYRDAIQYVHDQTIRGINEGKSPDELVLEVDLPPHLKDLPYLQQYYGTVPWSVRSIFDGYLGWFDGNATNLFELSPFAKAERMATLVGGFGVLVERAKTAYNSSDYIWAAELADYVLAAHPDHAEAKRIRADSFRALAEQQVSANGRNYYLTQALETEGKISLESPSTASPELLAQFDLANLFQAMRVNLNPRRSLDVNRTVGFRFPDVDEAYTIQIRRGVAIVRPEFPENPDLTVETDSMTWKQILTRQRNPLEAAGQGDLKVDKPVGELLGFLALFLPDAPPASARAASSAQSPAAQPAAETEHAAP